MFEAASNTRIREMEEALPVLSAGESSIREYADNVEVDDPMRVVSRAIFHLFRGRADKFTIADTFAVQMLQDMRAKLNAR